MTGCWLAANAVHERGTMPQCDGRLVKVHLIPRALLRREGLQAFCDDERGWVWACGGMTGNAGCHGRLDTTRSLRIPRENLPPAVEQMAHELGLRWWLTREYGPQVQTCGDCGFSWPTDHPGDESCPDCETANVVRVAGEL